MNEYHRHFICARVDNIAQYVELIKRDYPGHLSDEAINWYFQKVCPRFLLSMGSVMCKGQPISRRIFDNFRILVRRLRSLPYLRDIELTIDNGGYQVQQGYIAVADIPVFTNQFYDLINYGC